MAPGFWLGFWTSAKRAYGALVVVLGLPVSFVFWRVHPDSRISVPLVLAIGFVLVGMVCTLAHLAFTTMQRINQPLPRVLQTRAQTTRDGVRRTICLLAPSTLFSHGTAVSFYFRDEEEFEILVGLGRVLNVQDDGRIQVEVGTIIRGQEGIMVDLEKNKKDMMARLRVKPTVPDLGPLWGYGGQDVGK